MIREQVRSIQKERGMTVLLTTHNMKEANSFVIVLLPQEWGDPHHRNGGRPKTNGSYGRSDKA